jgi:hypothetical protein
VAEQYDAITAYSGVRNLLVTRRPHQEPWAYALVATLRAVATGACYYGQEWETELPDSAIERAADAARYSREVAKWAAGSTGADSARAAQANVIRCVIGNPFRPAPAVDAAWLAWRGGIVRELAGTVYEERRLPDGTLDPARLAVLADALEDAGCANAELLGHLRGPAVHVRGCWAVDIVLGKS